MSNNRSVEKIRKMFIEAATKLQNGDAAGAKRGLEKVVKLAPNTAAAWYNLGLASQHLGQHSKAVKEYEKTLALNPNQVDAVINLALSNKELGQIEVAKKAAEKALNMVPLNPRTLNLMGSIHAEERNYDEARTYFSSALEQEPANSDARQNLSNALLETGDPDRAMEVLQPLLQIPQPSKEHLELCGQILLDQKKFNEVPPILNDLKERYPEDEGVKILEMSLCELINNHFRVIDVAQDILKGAPKNARVWSSLGNAYFQLDSIEKAKESYLKAIEHDSEHAEYRNNLGLAFSSLGMKEQAEENYRKSLELNPEYIEAYRNLIAMKKFKDLNDPDAVKILELWENAELNDALKCKLAFAVGKVFDDCGQYDDAFAAYNIGNELKSKEISMDFDQYFNHIDRIIEVFDAPPSVTVSTQDSSSEPIFVLGMSRSGTTLVEQIISRHPEVTGCGELPCIERAIGNLEKADGKMLVYPDAFLNLPPTALAAETDGYRDWVSRLHDISTGYYTDKMPFNFVHIWLIRSLFPNAAIIHCHRHPLDVITSNYFQLYGSDINFVYDLEVLTGYYIRYHRLMRHWHKVFAGDIYKVQYEALVADSEVQTRKLIEGARLEWNDDCLDQNRSDTAVRTASIWQVREGIYTSSRERWRRYEAHLQPAIQLLVQEGILDQENRYVDSIGG